MVIILCITAACNGDSSIQASQAVENYLQALVARDLNTMISASCSEWESQARLEFDSFAAVKLTLNNMACKQTDEETPYSLIGCKGSITANYGNEDLEIDVAERIYRVIKEAGEWRMCGYQ